MSFNLYFKELTKKDKENLVDIEGMLVCSKCGYQTENLDEKFYFVKRINNGIPETCIYCDSCLKSSSFVSNRKDERMV